MDTSSVVVKGEKSPVHVYMKEHAQLVKLVRYRNITPLSGVKFSGFT